MTTDLEHHLIAGMREYADGLQLRPDVLAGATRRHRRRTTLIRAVAGAGTLAVAGAVAMLLAAPPAPVAPAPPARPQRDVGYVTTQVLSALTGGTDRIIHTKAWLGSDTDPRSESWADPSTRSLHSVSFGDDGTTASVLGMVVADGQFRLTFVDYAAHTWSVKSRPDDGSGVSPSAWDPAQIQAGLTDGTVTMTGEEQVNGVATLHLTVAPPDGNPSGGQELWVDRDSYDVVRWVGHKGGGDDAAMTVRVDVDFLERTPVNLDLLDVVPPAGFTEVP